MKRSVIEHPPLVHLPDTGSQDLLSFFSPLFVYRSK